VGGSDGLGWNDINHGLINPDQVDLMVAIQKPFDYFDDCFDRREQGTKTYGEQVTTPLRKLTKSSGELMCANLGLAVTMIMTDFDPSLPNRIATKIQENVLGETAIGAVYRELRAVIQR
jgi:hypothetical protein